MVLIGDLHGYYYTLSALLDRVKAAPDQLVFLGDYVDRGLHSRTIVDQLIQLQSQGSVCLRGNHDDVIDFLVNDRCAGTPSEWVKIPSAENIVRWFSQHGLLLTLRSYGVSLFYNDRLPKTNEQLAKELKQVMPEDHKKFFRNLRLYWENNTHFAVHAFFRPDQELPRELRFHKFEVEETLWSRFNPAQIDGPKSWDKTLICGHTPTFSYGKTNQPVCGEKIRLIDLGLANRNDLCAYDTETDQTIQIPIDPRDLIQDSQLSPT